MPRAKKTRKIGKIGVSKENSAKLPKNQIKRKSHKGKKPGNRQHKALENGIIPKTSTRLDVRKGSKVKIDLNKYKSIHESHTDEITDLNTELSTIENDEKLDQLLTLAETRELSPTEQRYVDERINRHKVLCDLLGIAIEEGIDSDPYSHLDAINKEDFND
ncbi:MAG: GTPase-activating protein [Pseudomonadota bacterium]